jgi:hypothetical protein
MGLKSPGSIGESFFGIKVIYEEFMLSKLIFPS